VPFFFAWCGPDEAFGSEHLREDETIFAFDIAHQEGQIPMLSIDVINPHIGLLAPGRAQWAWLSYQSSTGTYPLFYGRLVALPSNLLGETVTLQFIARPNDYLAQKQAIANDLMVEPYYDPIWIDQSKLGDPDTVLEAYTMMWHVDRVTHVVSISEITFGEDGTEEFVAEDSFYDSVSISFAQSPQTQVVFNGTVQWTQTATGVIPLPDVSIVAWNGEQIVNDWPKPGDQLQNGWSIETSAVTNWSDQFANNNPVVIDVGGGSSTPTTVTIGDPSLDPKISGNIGIGEFPNMPVKATPLLTYNFTWTNRNKTHQNGDAMSLNVTAQYNEFGGLGGTEVTNHTYSVQFGDPQTGTAAALSESISWTGYVGAEQKSPPTTIIVDADGNPTGPVTIPSLFGQLALRYNLEFGRTEIINFVMNSDIQPIVLLPPDESVNQINLSMHGSDIGLPLDGGSAPIGDPGRSAFFPTDRGMLAVQYPMLVARAHLAQSARAAKVNFDCTFERALNLSCRKNALLHDLRLPGGQVLGKITEYHLKADGDKGELIGTVQIEATIGNSNTIVVDEGNPTYVEEAYASSGYQFYSDTTVALPSGDATIVAPPTYFDPTQMVLPLTFNQAVMAFQVHQGTPIDIIAAGGSATADPTWLEIVLVPVDGQDYEASYDLGTSTLVLPRMIDLAAPSA
jgi:hypothetical protein